MIRGEIRGGPPPYQPRIRDNVQPGDDILAIWRQGYTDVYYGSTYPIVARWKLNFFGENCFQTILHTAYGTQCQQPPELQPLTEADEFPGQEELIEAAKRQETYLLYVKDTGLKLHTSMNILEGLKAGYINFQRLARESVRKDQTRPLPSFEGIIRHTGALYIPLGRIGLESWQAEGLNEAMQELGLQPPTTPTKQWL